MFTDETSSFGVLLFKDGGYNECVSRQFHAIFSVDPINHHLCLQSERINYLGYGALECSLSCDTLATASGQ